MDRKPPDHRRLRNEEPPFTISQKQRWAKENLELKERLKAIENKMAEKFWWESDEFVRFLEYRARKGSTAEQIVDIVRKPHHFEGDFKQFQQWEDYHDEPT